MSKFNSINYKCKLTPIELADMCELHASGQMNNYQLAKKYGFTKETVDRYLNNYYYGIVPKHKQVTITLKSKEIQEFI